MQELLAQSGFHLLPAFHVKHAIGMPGLREFHVKQIPSERLISVFHVERLAAFAATACFT